MAAAVLGSAANADRARSAIRHGGAKTYWHLLAQRRIPTDYEVASTRLLYHPGTGFAVNTPAAAWMLDHGAEHDLRCADWDRFADPAATTYRDYVRGRHEREALIDGALRLAAAASSPRDWLHTLVGVLGPMRYAWHGLQMVSAYLAHLAPGSRIVIAALFQTADLLRCIDAFGRRLGAAPRASSTAQEARTRWEDEPMWQPTRAAIERLLIAYRWSECFAALTLVVKPALDEWLLHHLGALARAAGDEATRLLLWSLHEDTRWQRDWAATLAAQLAVDPDNRKVLGQAAAHWREEMQPIAASFAPLFGAELPQRRAEVDQRLDALRRASGLEPA